MTASKRNAILVIGAGAIGRGFLPWLFPTRSVRWFFIDARPEIVAAMKKAGGFRAYRARQDRYEERWIQAEDAWTPEQWEQTDKSLLREVAAVFINVGPRHSVAAARMVEGFDGAVILSENDPVTVRWVADGTALKAPFFAVPDVIASNTAPAELLAKDPLSLVTEDGRMFVDAGVKTLAPQLTEALGGEIDYLETKELLHKQWTAKLYLHNTPHCVVAYLGALAGVTYVHEAMRIPAVEKVVVGAMTEMLNSLKLRWEIPHDFLDWYAGKELARFRSPLLFDPISRVAREPLRKLEAEGRLLGAAQICLARGFVPENVLLGIGSALLFNNPDDADYHLVLMRQALCPEVLIRYVLGLRPGEALERVLRERFKWIIDTLTKMSPKECAP